MCVHDRKAIEQKSLGYLPRYSGIGKTRRKLALRDQDFREMSIGEEAEKIYIQSPCYGRTTF